MRASRYDSACAHTIPTMGFVTMRPAFAEQSRPSLAPVPISWHRARLPGMTKGNQHDQPAAGQKPPPICAYASASQSAAAN